MYADLFYILRKELFAFFFQILVKLVPIIAFIRLCNYALSIMLSYEICIVS